MTNIFKNIHVGLDAEAAIALLPQHTFATGMAIYLPADKAVLKNLYQVISALPVELPFSFFFILPHNLSLADDMDAIGRFLFLSNYHSLDNHTPFFIAEGLTADNRLHQLKQWCQQQGFSEPEFVMADVVKPASDNNSHAMIVSVNEQESFFASFADRLQNIECFWQPVIFKVVSLDEVQSLEKKPKDFDEKLQNENFQLYSLLSTIVQLQEEQVQHKFRMQYMEQQINNLKQFNSLIKSTNEVEKILTFYHTQYEVLPLWYKRFGHIIKILMGKREIPFISNKKEV